ncbi:type II RES/Xre toxin-antitoxin system antitoxin [Pedobacter deserti]|uniref:type II RES/Xre toxin-antitoxin system antitoxin n=1 Tax=Pedobacter deserti TaxID=2817382 RepID=UPI00210A457A|nr:antitoxin Xre/MbcA/ParS toxin-binding domain-containing protein [Pedobacter sp. SYSU D00382]
MTAIATGKHNKVGKFNAEAPEWLQGSFTNFEKMDFVKKGITKDSLVLFKQVIDVDYDHLSQVLGTTKTTLHKKQGNETFSASISEKVIALMDVYRFGYQVFSNREKFNKWVTAPNRSLDNRIPLEVMDTVFGIDEVKNIIGRIQHGVYS